MFISGFSIDKKNANKIAKHSQKNVNDIRPPS